MNIRRAGQADLPALTAFFNKISPQLDYQTAHWTEGVYPIFADVATGVDKQDLYLAVKGQQIVALMRLNREGTEKYPQFTWQKVVPDEGYLVIHILMVDPQEKGQGIAGEMLRFAAEQAKREGKEALRLDTYAQNLPAKKLYEKFGFTQIASDVLHPEGGNEDAWFDLYEYLL